MTKTTIHSFAVALLGAFVGAALPAQSQSVDDPGTQDFGVMLLSRPGQ